MSRPRWHEVDQLQAKLREDRKRTRGQRVASLQAMGLSDREVQRRVAEQDEALHTLERSYTPAGGGAVSDDELPVDPFVTSSPPQQRQRRTAAEIRDDVLREEHARGRLVEPDVEPVVERGEPAVAAGRVQFDLPATPGSTGRALTGSYRMFVGALSGLVVAAGAWLALLLLAQGVFDWPMWHPVLMVGAALAPLAGWLVWLRALRSDVAHYIRVGGRAPATWSKR